MLNHMMYAIIKQRSRVVSEKEHTKEGSELGSENKSAMIHVHTRGRKE